LPSYIGQTIKRAEDPRLITGHGAFADDLRPPGTLHVAFVRSPYGHAGVRSIDTTAARAQPGVEAVVTGHDLTSVEPMPLGPPPATAPAVPRTPVLARDEVFFVGQAVAAVAASDPYRARDAADLVEVDWEPLPAVTDPEEALRPGATQIHPDVPGNVAFTLKSGSDDVEVALAEADELVTVRVVNRRLAAVPLEPRAILAQYDAASDGLTISQATQSPHRSRDDFATIVGIPPERVRLVIEDVGGGFGAKIEVYPEEAATALLAWRLHRPVAWTDGRTENLRTMTQGRGHITEITLGLKRDGTFTGMRTHVIADIGGLLHPVGGAAVGSIMTMSPGPYRLPKVLATATAVYTNTAPIGPYRGAGRPEATYALERVVDVAARKIGMDPVELRRKNLLTADEFPHQTPTSLRYDSGDYLKALDVGLKEVDYDHWRAEQTRLRAQGRYIGIGVTTFVEPAGALAREYGEVRVDETGNVKVLTGSGPTGQGHETIYAQVAASELQVPVESIEVVHGDTAAVATGVGSFGSRSAILGGSAVLVAARKVKEEMSKAAADLLEVAPEDVELADGRFHVRGVPDVGADFAAVAARGQSESGGQAGFAAGDEFKIDAMAYPFGTHICVVEVQPETGEIAVLKYLGVEDCGNMINPTLVEGQLHGGFAQGFGEAMMERVIYDDDGQLRTGSLIDYAIPRAAHMPQIDFVHTVTRSPTNPLGAKGVGEAGSIASPPTIVNAVLDALAPLGVTHIDMPLTAPRVWAAIQAARANDPR
jgi:carbon-monoxide dehydrogenase large subunit